MTAWRTMVVEDQTLFCDLLVKLVALDPRFQLVGHSHDGETAWVLFERERPEFVVLDLHLPLLDGFALAHRIREAVPATRLLAVSSHVEPFTIDRVVRSGLHGYVEKDQPLTELETAMTAVAGGENYFTETFRQRRRKLAGAPPAGYRFLSLREQQVLALVADGHSSREIGARLGLSGRTVENHRHHIMQKLELKDGAALLHFALTNGFRTAG